MDYDVTEWQDSKMSHPSNLFQCCNCVPFTTTQQFFDCIEYGLFLDQQIYQQAVKIL